MENWGEMIKNQIYNKLLKPSLNQIENAMKQNIEEIKEKINDIKKIDHLENINKYNNNEHYDKKNNMIESFPNSDLYSKGTSNLINDKSEEVVKLGFKLFEKLKEKQKKLTLLEKETSKLIEDNIQILLIEYFPINIYFLFI